MFTGRWKRMVMTIISVVLILANFINVLPVMAQEAITEGNGLANLSYTFNTIDGTTLDSAVGDRPRMLIFFNVDCGLSQATMRNLTEKLPGIDMVAVDVGINSKEDVQAFKETYSQLYAGIEDITFCFLGDYIQIHYDYMYAYQNANPGVTLVNKGLPTIFYIGTDNMIKHATNNIQTLDQIKENLLTYFGYGVQKLEGTNPVDRELTTVADTKVTTTASGKPKVLILGDKTELVKEMLADIERNYPEGVDIYFLDMWSGSKDDAIAFKESVTQNSQIVYCYDTQGRYVDLPGIYLEAGGLNPSQIGYPILCYIDSDNKLQNVVKGAGTAEQVINILKSTCGYEPLEDPEIPPVVEDTFEVTFNYGGKVADVIKQIKKGDKVNRPEEVGVEGFILEGWYEDDGLTIPWNFEEKIIEGATTIYAKWIADILPPIEEEKEYTITFHYGEKQDNTTVVVKEGEKVQKPADPVAEGYEFKGWYKDEEFITPWDFEKDVVEGPQTIYAKWEEKIIIPPVVEEEKYTVSFNHMGKGEDSFIEVKKGEKLERPADPVAEGYEFKGWYKEEEFTTLWDFENDTVTGEQTLYAKWENKEVEPEEPVLPESKAIKVSPIADLVYTGKALKPVVQVYDGEKLLQLNKDYKVTYKNNTNANAGAVQASEEFNKDLPHVIITGKGNYSGSLQVNFNIHPIEVVDENDVSDSRLKIKFTDQLPVNDKKAVAPFKSVSLGKTLKSGKDYTVTLAGLNATDSKGEKIQNILPDGKIPAGAKGSFLLNVTFKGNYSGTVKEYVSVADKTDLLKNATITLKKEFKSVEFETFVNEYNHILPKDAYEVKMGNILLEEGKDYTVKYKNINKTGTASLVIIGMGTLGEGSYQGIKTVPFKLTGKALTASRMTFENFGNLTFTGEELTHKDLIVKYDGKALSQETDYGVSYIKNNKVGTSTMIITVKEGSFYMGSVKKTFKITAADITGVKQQEAVTVPYSKAGARPEEQVELENELGQKLVKGKDYTLKYVNNKAVAEAGMGPVIEVKGKGNYTGTLKIPFTITKADLAEENITIQIKAVTYNEKKAHSFIYQPKVTIKDGNKTLSSKTDYVVEYENNTQAAYNAYYIDKAEGAPQPVLKITAKEGSNYTTAEPIIVELPVYRIKLTAKNTYAVISEVSYTGKQATPEVEVYYSADDKVIKDVKSKGLTSQEEIEALGLVKLDKSDYQISYGTNLLGGVNKGSLKIEGRGALYGGSVTLKFNIGLRDLTN